MDSILEIQTNNKNEWIDITDSIGEIARESSVKEGLCIIFVPHTTAGITINENADPDVTADIDSFLKELVPENSNYKHMEGNSPAHIKASLVGADQRILISGGGLVLGKWQGIYLTEFDGPRRRRVIIKIIKG